jgi:hypothetical protein
MMLQCESFVACGTLVSFRPLVHVRMFLEMFLVKEYLVALSTFFMVNSFSVAALEELIIRYTYS